MTCLTGTWFKRLTRQLMGNFVQTPAPRREPVFNIPGPVLWLIALFVAIHLARSALSPDLDNWWTFALAFIPARYSGLAEQLPGGHWATVTSWLSHALVHGDMFHLAVNSAWMLAFGSALSRRLGALRFFMFSALCTIAGAAAFLAGNLGLIAPMVGASGAIAGLMGGTMRFLFNAIGGPRPQDLRENIRAIPRMSLAQAVQDRRVVFSTIGWVLINLAFGFGASALTSAGGIAWEAHLGGYFAGLLLFGWFDPGRGTPYGAQDFEPRIGGTGSLLNEDSPTETERNN